MCKKEGMEVRFMVAIDYSADSLEDAYTQLRKQLPQDCSYETDDEFFIDGEHGDPDELQQVRMAVLGKEE